MNLEFEIWIWKVGQNKDVFNNIIFVSFGQGIFTILPVTLVKKKVFGQIKPIVTRDKLLL